MEGDYPRLHDGGRNSPDLESDLDGALVSPTALTGPPTIFPSPTSRGPKRSMMSRTAPRPIHTPTSPLSSSIPHNLLPSAPASPPTPAPSPSPTQQELDWSQAKEDEDPQFRAIRSLFKDLDIDERKRLLGEVLNMCDTHLLSFVKDFVTPRLQKDPFMVLPDELILRVSWTAGISI
jgi:F-box and WD-40 domain protein CDC4